MMAKGRVRLLKGVVWAIGLYPAAQLAWWLRDGVFGLGANPIERVLHHSGWWTLVLLLVTLAVTPLRRVTGRNELAKLRRPLGLFAFFWATLHLGIYLGLDQLFDWTFILEDVLERPFITVGMAAWAILLPLAITSTRGWIRRLGRRWTRLHQGVYIATILGVIHFYWRVRADTREPFLFAAAFVALMALRMRWTGRKARPRPARRDPKEERDAGDGAEGAGTGAGAGDPVGAGAGTG
jgi:sulfoxide reductase heme-binding subunit YedZ